MNINYQAPFVARKEIFIQAPPEAVWKLLTDIDAWSQWQPGVAWIKLAGPIASGSVFKWKAGGLKITSTLQVVEPNRRIGWTGRSIGMQARHLWVFKSHENGTQVITEESLDGWLARLMKLVMPGFLERSIDTSLKTLCRKVESNGKKGG